MKFPKGKGFDLAGGLSITVALDDYTLIGTYLGGVGDRHHDDPPPIHVDVQVNEEAEFILLQLSCCLKVDHKTELPVGTIIAINVQQILFIGPGVACEEDR